MSSGTEDLLARLAISYQLSAFELFLQSFIYRRRSLNQTHIN